MPATATPELPYVVISGPSAGPTIAVVAGVHGGKVAAVHAAEHLKRTLPPFLLRGRVLIVAPANAAGFRAGLAQISPDDSLNLNRVFPGDPNGRPTERVAARIVREIVSQSDYLIDMHGSDGDEAVGRFAYAARPGLSAATDSAALALARAWGSPLVVWDDAGPRNLAESRFLQTAAHLSGVPAITVFEAGNTRDSDEARDAFVLGVWNVLAAHGMVNRPARPCDEAALDTDIRARRAVSIAPVSGQWSPAVAPDQEVAVGELLGTLNDSVGVRRELRASVAGKVLHQRLPSRVSANTPLVILGVRATP